MCPCLALGFVFFSPLLLSVVDKVTELAWQLSTYGAAGIRGPRSGGSEYVITGLPS